MRGANARGQAMHTPDGILTFGQDEPWMVVADFWNTFGQDSVEKRGASEGEEWVPGLSPTSPGTWPAPYIT